MFTFTKKTHYALIALTHLARRPDGLASARAIASEYHMPLPILTNVMKNLAGAGLVYSERGARGGYRLAKPVDRINLSELLRVIEGPVRLFRCVDRESAGSRQRCDLEDYCPIRLPARKIHTRLIEFLEGLTLAEILEGQSEAGELREVNADSTLPGEAAMGKVAG